jgi:hypothetical protein
VPSICANNNLPTLAISAAPAQGLPGGQSVLTVRASNPHTSDVSTLSLTTSLSPGATVVGARSNLGQPSFQPGGNSVTLVVDSLPAGQTVELVIDVRLADNVAPGGTVSASVNATVMGFACVQASTALTITPAGIPVTGAGPGWGELRVMLFAALTLAAGSLWAGRLVLRKRLARR